jgi:hypothetical protein
MNTIFSCGHKGEHENGVALSLKTTEIDFDKQCLVPSISYGFYCQRCAKEYERNGFILHNKAEEEAYLKSNRSEWKSL